MTKDLKVVWKRGEVGWVMARERSLGRRTRRAWAVFEQFRLRRDVAEHMPRAQLTKEGL